MSAANKQIISKANAAFEQNDTEAFLALCTEDVQWQMWGSNLVSGKDAVRKFMAPMDSAIVAYSFEHMIADGDLVACNGTMNIETKDGGKFHSAYCDIYKIVDGKIKSFQSYVVDLNKK